MNSSRNFFIGIILSILALVAGLAFMSRANNSANLTALASGQISVVPEFYDLGTVKMSDGLVTREYTIKNITNNPIKLKKISTSCMCTQAKLVYGETETNFFGMEGHGDANPPVNVEIAAGDTAKIVSEFDPAAHGPQGVGPIDRAIILQFSDPAGIVELKFGGNVVI